MTKLRSLIADIFIIMLSGNIASAEANTEHKTYSEYSNAAEETVSASRTSVNFDYDVSVETKLDNREYDPTPLDFSRTIFGVRACIGLGVRINQNKITHRILAGADPLYEFGGGWKVEPLLYYQMSMPLKRSKLEINAGAFPRVCSRAFYSEAFFSEADLFYNRSYKGLQFSWTGRRFYYEFGCNWTGQINAAAPQRREQFYIYSGGEHRLMTFSKLGYAFVMHHYANSVQTRGVVDDILASIYWECNFGSLIGIQALKSRLGVLQGYQFDRLAMEKASLPTRGEWAFELRNWNVALVNYMSFGKDLMPLYDRTDASGDIYGSNLYSGDPLTRNNPSEKCGLYDRLGICYEPNICKGLKLRLQVDVMFNLQSYIGTRQIIGISYTLPYFVRSRKNKHNNKE